MIEDAGDVDAGDKVVRDSMRTLERLFSVMDALVGQDGVSLAGLSAQTGLHKSTIHRFLTTLTQHGWAATDPRTEGYTLGPRFLALCQRAWSQVDLRSLARPCLEALRDATAESANLGVLQGDQVVCLDSVYSHEPLRMSFEPGRMSPFHATGVGKAIVAHLPAEQRHLLLTAQPLRRYTPTTVVDPERLQAHLQGIREKGYAFDDMELSDQVRCVAAPIFGARGQVVGAISVSGPAFRMTLDRMYDMALQVSRSARSISAQLGYGSAGPVEGDKA